MIEIKTTNSFVMLVDEADYEFVSQWNWTAVKKDYVRYAMRSVYVGGPQKTNRSRRVYLHRQILGEPPGLIDHLNGNGLDNRRANLRVCSNSENQRNRDRAQINSKSGVRGVYKDKRTGKWVAAIRHLGKKIHIGVFSDLDAAALARRNKERELWSPEDRFRSEIATPLYAAAPKP